MLDPLKPFMNALYLIWVNLPAPYVSFTIVVFIFVAFITIVKLLRGL